MTSLSLKQHTLCSNKSLNIWANTLLQHCLQAITATCNDQHINSVILTGSFSRGEASIFLENNTPVLAGDIEFLLVSQKTGKLAKERTFYNRFKNRLGAEISKSMGSQIEVDIGLVGADYFPKKLRPSIFVYDLVTYGKTLYGTDCLSKVTIRKEDIPQDDALALLMNRTIELLILSESEPGKAYYYHLVKLLLDMAGSMLAFTGNYVAPYEDRPSALRKLLNDGRPDMQDLSLFGLPELVEHAAQIKLNPEPDEKTKKIILSNDGKIQNYLGQLIYWQMQQILGFSGDISSVIKEYFSREPLFTVIRGWIKYLLHPFRSPDAVNIFLLPGVLMKKSPRNLIYSSAMKSFLGIVLDHSLKITAKEDLYVFNRGHEQGQGCKQACELWNQVIKHN